MLKFQEKYNIVALSFEDFILVIFVLIDVFYKKVVPDKVKFRRNVDKTLLSDSEIITISLCGELLGIVSENAWFNPSTFFGYKVHVLTTERGAIKIFEILSATRAKRSSQITRKKTFGSST